MWKVSLIRWSVCPLPEIPSCGAKKRKEKKKRPKLMSLGRSIQLSGLYWEIKSSSLLLFPFAALYDEGWEGGWKDGPRISDVSYCRQRRWQVWHLADETHELPSENSSPQEKNETNRCFVKPEYFDRPLVAGLQELSSSQPSLSRFCVNWEEEHFLGGGCETDGRSAVWSRWTQ